MALDGQASLGRGKRAPGRAHHSRRIAVRETCYDAAPITVPTDFDRLPSGLQSIAAQLTESTYLHDLALGMARVAPVDAGSRRSQRSRDHGGAATRRFRHRAGATEAPKTFKVKQMSNMFLKPAVIGRGRAVALVRDPMTGIPLAEEGEWKAAVAVLDAALRDRDVSRTPGVFAPAPSCADPEACAGASDAPASRPSACAKANRL
jgi:hypothetical protein